MENCITIAEAAQRLERSRSRVDQLLRELAIEPGWVGSTRFLTAEQFEQVSARISTPCKPGPKGHRQVFGGAANYASSYQVAETKPDAYTVCVSEPPPNPVLRKERECRDSRAALVYKTETDR